MAGAMAAGPGGPNVWSCATLVAPQPIGPRRCLGSEDRAPRAAFQPPRRSPCASNTCLCAGWASIPSWEQRVRSERVGAAAQLRCVYGGLARAVCAVHGAARCGDAAAPEGGAAKKAVRGHKGLADGGNRRAGFRGALQLELVGARCAAPAALLRRESSFPRTRRARMQTSEQRADPKGMARALGCVRERRWRATDIRCNAARRLGGWEGRAGH